MGKFRVYYRHAVNLIDRHTKRNVLFTNSLNLMIASGVTAAFGFIFWIIIAHSFKVETVGLATTLISVSSLLSLLGLAGYDTVLVRLLAKSKNRNEQINNSLIITGLVTVLIAIVFYTLIPILSPKLNFIRSNNLYLIYFIVFTVFMTWNILTNAILVAYRRTSLVLIIGVIFSLVKISLPFIVHTDSPISIYVMVGVAQVVNVALSIGVLMHYFQFIPSLKINLRLVKETLRYGLSIYLANVINLLPDSALPLIIINQLGATQAAYFYVAFNIAGLLYTIAFATSQVLLAEISYDENSAAIHTRRALRIILSLLVPATVFIVLLAPSILNLFGHTYPVGATGVLIILSISGFAVLFYAILSTIFKQTKNIPSILVMTALNAISIIILSLMMVNHNGLLGIGWAWLIGTCIATAGGYIMLRLTNRHEILVKRISQKVSTEISTLNKRDLHFKNLIN